MFDVTAIYGWDDQLYCYRGEGVEACTVDMSSIEHPTFSLELMVLSVDGRDVELEPVERLSVGGPIVGWCEHGQLVLHTRHWPDILDAVAPIVAAFAPLGRAKEAGDTQIVGYIPCASLARRRASEYEVVKGDGTSLRAHSVLTAMRACHGLGGWEPRGGRIRRVWTDATGRVRYNGEPVASGA